MPMEEAIITARNMVVNELATYMGVVISLSDELEPMSAVPYGYYSFITPYVSSGEGGNYESVLTDNGHGGKQILQIRNEVAEMGLSFNFCSHTHTVEETEINGETEALMLATKAVGWFKNEGGYLLSNKGLVVLSVHNLASRSAFLGDTYIRRWGFDVTARYRAQTIRTDDLIKVTHITEEKESD